MHLPQEEHQHSLVRPYYVFLILKYPFIKYTFNCKLSNLKIVMNGRNVSQHVGAGAINLGEEEVEPESSVGERQP